MESANEYLKRKIQNLDEEISKGLEGEWKVRRELEEVCRRYEEMKGKVVEGEKEL